MRRRFARRMVIGVVFFFGLIFLASALAVTVLSGAFGLDRGLIVPAAILGLILLWLAFVVVVRSVRRLAGPVGDVMEAADRLAGGDYATRVEERGPREMRRLARSFNAMAERLGSNDEQRRHLLADLAHELRTPLSVIQGNVEGILDGVYPPDRAHLDPVIEETRVMSRLLGDLQTLSTAEAGALRLHRERVEPAELVDDTIRAFRSQADANGIALAARIVPGLPAVDVDAVRIGEVFGNLLQNALRHAGSGGSVVVRAGTTEDGGVAFSVEDDGPGIPTEVLPHVFDRFVKAADSGGAGLGLAIAKSLVEAHGGEITAESRLGTGTTVRFVLPSGGSSGDALG